MIVRFPNPIWHFYIYASEDIPDLLPYPLLTTLSFINNKLSFDYR